MVTQGSPLPKTGGAPGARGADLAVGCHLWLLPVIFDQTWLKRSLPSFEQSCASSLEMRSLGLQQPPAKTSKPVLRQRGGVFPTGKSPRAVWPAGRGARRKAVTVPVWRDALLFLFAVGVEGAAGARAWFDAWRGATGVGVVWLGLTPPLTAL